MGLQFNQAIDHDSDEYEKRAQSPYFFAGYPWDHLLCQDPPMDLIFMLGSILMLLATIDWISRNTPA